MERRRLRRLPRGLFLLAVGLSSLTPGPSTTVHAQSLVARLGPSAWIARLSDPDPVIRRGAAYALGRFAPPDPSVHVALFELLARETDPSVALATISALARGRHPPPRGASGSWANFLPTGTRTSSRMPLEARAAALIAAANTDDARVPAELMRTSLADTAEVVDATVRALALLPDAAFAPLIAPARRQGSRIALVLRAIGERGDPRWSVLVLEQLRATMPVVIESAIGAAVRMRLTEAAPDLVELARDASDRSVRRAALRALGALGTPVDPAVLRGALEDPATRQAALEACGQLGDPVCIELVSPLLEAEWSADRRAAAATLGAIGGSRAARALATRLGAERDAEVRVALLHALAITGAPEALPAVAHAAGVDASGRQALAVMALKGARIEAPAGLSAAVGAHEPAALRLAGLLGTLEAERLAALAAPDANVRVAAALSFARGGSGRAVEALQSRLLHEDDEGVRVALVSSLAVQGGPVARGALIGLLSRETDGPTLAAVAAAEAAGRLGLRVAVPAIASLMEDPRPLVRTVAARALGRLQDAPARGLLERAGQFDPDPEARGVALLALAQVAGPASYDTIQATRRIAWTGRLADLAARADAVAQDELNPGVFEGASVVRIAGADPRSVWALSLPDGDVLFAVASGDGEVLMPGAPSLQAPLQRVDR
jgi:HEAT repeat protein